MITLFSKKIKKMIPGYDYPIEDDFDENVDEWAEANEADSKHDDRQL